jgi:hypothetical protein
VGIPICRDTLRTAFIVVLEKLIVAIQVKKFSDFTNTEGSLL